MHKWMIRIYTDFHWKTTDFHHEIVACLTYCVNREHLGEVCYVELGGTVQEIERPMMDRWQQNAHSLKHAVQCETVMLRERRYLACLEKEDNENYQNSDALEVELEGRRWLILTLDSNFFLVDFKKYVKAWTFLYSDLFRLWRPIGPICRSILVSQIRAQWKNSPVQHRHKYNIHIRAFHLPNGCSTIYVIVPVLVKFGFEAIYSWCRYYTFWQWMSSSCL